MGRVLLQELAFFALPFLLYLVYFLWKRRNARITGAPEPVWERGHWYWLTIAGLVLMIATFVIYEAVLTDPSGPGYRPSGPPR